MKVKYNEELAKAVLKVKVRGAFYQETDKGSEQVFLTIITHWGEDLICLFEEHSDFIDHSFARFRILTQEDKSKIAIRLPDLEVGDIIACDMNNKEEVLVGVLSGIHDNVIEVSCWAGIDSDRLEKGNDRFCQIEDCKCPSKEARDKFLNILDKNGYCLRDNKPCKKEKHFYPFKNLLDCDHPLKFRSIECGMVGEHPDIDKLATCLYEQFVSRQKYIPKLKPFEWTLLENYIRLK